MTRPKPGFVSRLQGFADFIGAARDCAGASRAQRTPSREALKALGLDPKSFHDGR